MAAQDEEQHPTSTRREDSLRKKLLVTNYTRHQAIEDGQLVDVTDVARELMHETTIPIALTDTVWRRVQARGSARVRSDGRVREILRAAGASVLDTLATLGRTRFTVKVGRKTVHLAIEFHEADEGGLVGTIMLDGAG